MSQATVKIRVVDGVALVDAVPPGVAVQITDYDVDTRGTTERDEAGVPCSRYSVTAAGERKEQITMTATQFERQTYNVPEVAKIIGVGRNAVYEAAKRGDVRAIQIGKRIVIPRSEVERLLNMGAVPQVA